MSKYWRAFKMAWRTFRFVVAHERAHERWEAVYNRVMDERINHLLRGDQ